MSRLAFFARNPRRALAGLTSALAAAGLAVGTGADFSASSANPANTFSAGTLSIDNSKSGAAILTASNLKPGGSAQTGTVDIKNAGSLAGAFKLAKSSLADSGNADPVTYPLSGKLNLVVKDCGAFVDSTAPDCSTGTTVYSGTLSGMSQQSLGTFAADDKHRYEFSVALDASAGNEYQSGKTSVRFDWTAAQV